MKISVMILVALGLINVSCRTTDAQLQETPINDLKRIELDHLASEAFLENMSAYISVNKAEVDEMGEQLIEDLNTTLKFTKELDAESQLTLAENFLIYFAPAPAASLAMSGALSLIITFGNDQLDKATSRSTSVTGVVSLASAGSLMIGHQYTPEGVEESTRRTASIEEIMSKIDAEKRRIAQKATAKAIAEDLQSLFNFPVEQVALLAQDIENSLLASFVTYEKFRRSEHSSQASGFEKKAMTTFNKTTLYDILIKRRLITDGQRMAAEQFASKMAEINAGLAKLEDGGDSLKAKIEKEFGAGGSRAIIAFLDEKSANMGLALAKLRDIVGDQKFAKQKDLLARLITDLERHSNRFTEIRAEYAAIANEL